MTLLDGWVRTPLATAAGWALLHSLWEGAVVAAALCGALLVIRSSRVRYAVACLALATMLAGFGVTFVRMMPPNPIRGALPERALGVTVPNGFDNTRSARHSAAALTATAASTAGAPVTPEQRCH